MKMYVANTTQFDRQFQYRVAGSMGMRTQVIPRGGQIQITGTLSRDEIASIVEQQEVYGMIAAHDVGAARNHIYALYAVDKVVTEAQMRLALERNLQLMSASGEQQRKAAAVGISELIKEDSPETYLGANISVKEFRRDGGVPDVNEEHFHRMDGDYSNQNFDAPIAPVKRGRGRPRRVRAN